MSHHDAHGRKAKKLQQFLRNRRQLITQQLNEAMGRSRDLERERDEADREALLTHEKRKGKTPGNTVWSARYQEIMDRNTGRKRMATERWNRFAGTEDGGGKGL